MIAACNPFLNHCQLKCLANVNWQGIDADQTVKFTQSAQAAFNLPLPPLRSVLFYDRLQFTLGIAVRHCVQRNWLDLACLAGGAESFVARLADFLHRLGRGGEELARVEVLGILREVAAGGAGGGPAEMGGGVYLGYATPVSLPQLFSP